MCCGIFHALIPLPGKALCLTYISWHFIDTFYCLYTEPCVYLLYSCLCLWPPFLNIIHCSSKSKYPQANALFVICTYTWNGKLREKWMTKTLPFLTSILCLIWCLFFHLCHSAADQRLKHNATSWLRHCATSPPMKTEYENMPPQTTVSSQPFNWLWEESGLKIGGASRWNRKWIWHSNILCYNKDEGESRGDVNQVDDTS